MRVGDASATDIWASPSDRYRSRSERFGSGLQEPAPRPAFVCRFDDAKRITEPRASYRRVLDSQKLPKRRYHGLALRPPGRFTAPPSSPDEQSKPQSEGHCALAISNAITRLHREHYGRGPDQARTIIDRNYVITFLDDIYVPVERTLIEAGEQDSVRETRLAFQRAMKEKFSAAVEEVMDRKVIAFLSQVHFDPDISQETFVLEPEPDDRLDSPAR